MTMKESQRLSGSSKPLPKMTPNKKVFSISTEKVIFVSSSTDGDEIIKQKKLIILTNNL